MKNSSGFHFVCGMVAMAGVNMMRQDWYGLEGYIALCRIAWTDLHWTVGAAIALAAIIASAFGRAVETQP